MHQIIKALLLSLPLAACRPFVTVPNYTNSSTRGWVQTFLKEAPETTTTDLVEKWKTKGVVLPSSQMGKPVVLPPNQWIDDGIPFVDAPKTAIKSLNPRDEPFVSPNATTRAVAPRTLAPNVVSFATITPADMDVNATTASASPTRPDLPAKTTFSSQNLANAIASALKARSGPTATSDSKSRFAVPRTPASTTESKAASTSNSSSKRTSTKKFKPTKEYSSVAPMTDPAPDTPKPTPTYPSTWTPPTRTYFNNIWTPTTTPGPATDWEKEMAEYPYNPWFYEQGTTTVYDIWWNPISSHTMTAAPQRPSDDWTVIVHTPPEWQDYASFFTYAKRPLDTVDDLYTSTKFPKVTRIDGHKPHEP